MAPLEAALSVISLTGFIWVALFQLPRASRQRDAFAIGCSLLTGLLALFGWLFIGIGTHSW